MTVDAQEWHQTVRHLFLGSAGYRQYAESAPFNGRLIPLCTPVAVNPEFLVIGKNHSVFDTSNPAKAEQIASDFARSVPTVNTYVAHNHTFAAGLRRVAQLAGLEVDEGWVGTNRCPIQTGPEGIGRFDKAGWYKELYPKMDTLLHELIRAIRPRHVLACGLHAAGLFYPETARMEDMRPREVALAGSKTLIIPLPHPSRASNFRTAAERLARFRLPV